MDVVPCMQRILVEHLQNNYEIGKKIGLNYVENIYNAMGIGFNT